MPSVLQCLAEREVKVEAILFIQVGSLQLRAHRSDVRLREPEGLQVREAPISLAQMRRQLDTLAIGAETLVLATGRLQRMAVAHPDLGVARILGEHVCIQPDRLLVFADADEDGSLQVSIAGIARLGFERAVDLCQRRRCFVLTMQHERVVVTRRCEAGRELQAALQHALGIGIASEPSSDLRQHAQRRYVRGMLLEVCTQLRLRNRDLVVAESCGGFEQARIARRKLDVLRVSLVGTARVADRSEVIAERSPRIRHLRLEAHRTSQGCDRAFAIATGTERQAELVMRSGPVRLRLRERFENSLRRDRIAGASLRHAEQTAWPTDGPARP